MSTSASLIIQSVTTESANDNLSSGTIVDRFNRVYFPTDQLLNYIADNIIEYLVYLLSRALYWAKNENITLSHGHKTVAVTEYDVINLL